MRFTSLFLNSGGRRPRSPPRTCILLLLPVLAACATVAAPPDPLASPCAVSEASYACQVERYRNVNTP